MSCQIQDASAALLGGVEVFEAVVNNDLLDVLTRVARKHADFRELSPQGREFAPQNPATLGHRLFGKGDLQVAHADAPKLGMKKVDDLRQRDACCAGNRPRQSAQDMDYRPRERVLNAVSHSGEA